VLRIRVGLACLSSRSCRCHSQGTVALGYIVLFHALKTKIVWWNPMNRLECWVKKAKCWDKTTEVGSMLELKYPPCMLWLWRLKRTHDVDIGWFGMWLWSGVEYVVMPSIATPEPNFDFNSIGNHQAAEKKSFLWCRFSVNLSPTRPPNQIRAIQK
jgi:hypothetical protein